MDYSGLISLGGAIFNHVTAPDAPKIDPYEATPIEKKSLTEYLPEIESLMSSQADMALSFMDGEIPDSVADQIKMYAGENAMQRGFGQNADRSNKLFARDLGLSALDLMERGQGMANYLVNQTRSIMADDLAIDVSNANMAYDAWASGAQLKMDEWRGESSRRADTIGGIASGGAQLATSYYTSKQDTKNAAKYQDLLAELKI